MKKFYRKCLSSLLAVGMIVSVTGCSKTEKEDTNSNTTTSETNTTQTDKLADAGGAEANTLPITDKDITLTIYMDMPTGAKQIYNSYTEHPVTKQMMEETGLKLEFMHPSGGSSQEFFNTTLASGIYPDLFARTGMFDSNYPGGVDGAIDDDILLNMNDLIDQYAPNYLQLMSQFDEDIQKKIRSDKGTIIRFGTMVNPPFLEGRVHGGLVIRQDLLEKYGLEIPNTYDEFDNALKVFKENGISSPLGISKDSIHRLAPGFNVTYNGFFVRNGQTMYARTQPEFKEFLTRMADWYQKGYFSPDLATLTYADSLKQFRACQTAVSECGGWELITNDKIGGIEDPKFSSMGVPYLRQNEDDVLKLIGQLASPEGTGWFVTSTCKNPVEAIKFVDYLHMPETQQLTAWGPEKLEDGNVLWEMKDGKKVFSSFMKENPDFDYGIARDRYTANPLQIMWEEEMEKQQYDYPVVVQSWDNWKNNTDMSEIMPYWVTLTTDESRELSDIMNQINTYTDEMVLKMITGVEPVASFDTMVEKIKGMNIDRAIEIRQQAYERYLTR
ncbi:MAG: extracellular solute-binding protein [Cellulosilyticaceae bacterium]